MIIGDNKNPGRMNVKVARWASLANLMALGLSAILYLMDIDIVGLIMLIIALLAFCCLLGTGVYRIAGGQPFDDIERAQMDKAYSRSYWIVGVSLIIGVLLLQMVPAAPSLLQSEDVYTFLFWSLTSVIMVLPAALLAWELPTDEIDPDEI